MAAVIELPVKKRRISEKDWQKVEDHIKREHSKRKTDSFRKIHETIWREVDRQVYMKSPEKRNLDPRNQRNDWHSAIELGELAKASEIITADVMRLAFPTTREWYEAHVELPAQLDPQTGQNRQSQEDQVFMDGTVRAFMAQQHLDFGFKARMALSVKEALHHGSFVAEARQESALLVHSGSGIQSLSAPVWVPHSMWNSYPDPSPSVLGTNMLYTGSMIIEEYMPRWKLREVAEKGGEQGWMSSQLNKVPKRRNKAKDVETEDVELIKYFGDLVIDRKDGADIFLPNSKVILANGIIVFYSPNKLPFPEIIYNGYEKLDVRDPYFISPLIKMAPMHKVATVLCNKYLNIVALHGEPPLIYDGNDPAFVMNGGPVIAPGWKGATKGKAEFKTMEVGDPNAVLQGLQLALEHIRQGTGNEVSRVFPDSSDKTATESRLQAMRGEVRIVDFVDKLEFSLKTFLYMQHEINKRELQTYSFYNPEMDAPDFMHMTKKDLPPNVHFDVVGSKGILGEEERAQKMSVVTAFAAGNPMFAPLLKRVELLKEMYQDAGVKNPERFLNVPDDEMAEIEERLKAQFEEMIRELEGKNLELEKDLAIARAVNEAKILEADRRAESQARIAEAKAAHEIEKSGVKTMNEIARDDAKTENEIQSETVKTSLKVAEKLAKEETSNRTS